MSIIRACLAALLIACAFAASPRVEAVGEPVVLLHGCCWGSPADMNALAARFTAEGYDVHNLRLDSWNDSAANAVQLKTYVDSRGLGAVHIVAHSMGGNAGRWYVKALGGNVKSLTLIDTPNEGDWALCYFGVTSLCPNGAFMQALNFGDDTPGSTRYAQFRNTQRWWQYVLDGGVCLVPVTGAHSALPAQQDVFNKALAVVRGVCP